jgi:SAM-dependent methyltransferase
MSMNDKCPNCGEKRMSVFYEVDNIPVHSCLMLKTREESVSFPRDDLKLGVCDRCGFVSNVVFDEKYYAYSSAYEDQQSFSPTFNKFATQLAEGIVEKHGLRGKRVVEIGCGKGDFLALVCELGGNDGVGIDPTCVKERIKSSVADRITVIPDYYSEKYAEYVGDMIMCRHTLEHIYRTNEFMSTIRRSVEDRMDTVVFFEIPDGLRVIRDTAFEDVYYEHCSYFSPGSVARLFRQTGYEVTDVALEYDDQYLLIEALPAARPSRRIHPLEESPEEMLVHAESYSKGIGETLDRWRDDLTRMYDERRRPVIWGSGSKCVAFLTTIGMNNEIEHVVDINPHRHGKFIPGLGREIESPDILKKADPQVVIVMNRVYTEEIRDQLSEMGLSPEIIAL